MTGSANEMMAAGVSAETSKAIIGNVDSGVTATGSSSQANSYAIRAAFTQVTGGGATTGVRLPAMNPSEERFICNQSGSNCLVYPPTGGKLNDGAANAALTLADNESMIAKCINTVDFGCLIGTAS